VHREYPNKISHVLNGDADARPPRELTPAFYGCYDWHSAVHNHWLLARLARYFPASPFAPRMVEALRQSLTADNIRCEVAYFNGEGRQSFERPYGLAWLLQLAQELGEWEAPGPRQLATHLQPLEMAAVARLETWLNKLDRPIRTGEHNQTAFSLGLMIDYAQSRNKPFLELLIGRAKKFYGKDKGWRFDFEPSGEDFLSPGLAEADAMRRVLSPPQFAAWFNGFFPRPLNLRPVVPPDRSDPKFSHLDGLNLSRAWMLEGIASALGGARVKRIQEMAGAHASAGLSALAGEHYVGSHWLGTFAVYLLTGRGMKVAVIARNRTASGDCDR
jgi:hypothetical protein